MENASEALKMAGAIILFTMALASVMNTFTQARAASDAVLNKNDYLKTYYSADATAEGNGFDDKNNHFNLAYQKIVGVDEVISTMYNYRSEGTTILFYTAKAKVDNVDARTSETIYEGNFDERNYQIDPVVLYYTEAIPSVLAKSSLNLESYTYRNQDRTINPTKISNRAIFGLSASDELTRQEPWTGGDAETRLFLNDLIAGRNADNSHSWDSTSNALGTNATYFVSNKQVKELRTDGSSYIRHLRYGFDLFNETFSLGTDYSGGKHPTSIHKLTNSSQGFFGFNENARFVERIGEYDYKSRTVNSDNDFINEGTVELSNDEVLEAEATSTTKRVIQFIYLQ